MNSQRINNLLTAGMLAVFFAMYIATLKPCVSSGDTAELSTAGITLGVAHSPGYPLYTLLGRCAQTLFPFANSAYRMNIMSTILAFACVFITALFFLRKNLASALIAAAGLLITPIFWKEAVISEVFSLNLLCASILFYIVLNSITENDVRKNFTVLYAITFLLGFFIGNHHTLVLLMPGIAVYGLILVSGLSFKEKINVCLYSGLFFVLGVSIYAYIYIRSHGEPLLDWEDPQTLKRFLGVVGRMRYGSLSLAQGEPRAITVSTIIEEIGFFGKLMFKQVNILILAAAVIGFIKSYIDDKRFWLINTLFFVFTGPFIFIWANVPHNPSTEYIMERFFLLSLLPLCFFAGFSVQNLRPRFQYAAVGAVVIILIFGGYNIRAEFLANRQSLQIYDMGKNVLKHLPEKSLLIADRADETEFCLAYLQYAIRARMDISFIDANAGVSKSIYGDDYYLIWGQRRLAIRNLVESKIIQDYPSPVYYATLLPEQTTIQKQPEGLLHIAKGSLNKNPGVWSEVLFIPRGGLLGDDREQQAYSQFFKELGLFYLIIGNQKLAEKYFRDFLNSGGLWRDSGINAAYDAYAHKQYSLAETFYMEIIKRDPENYQAMNNLGVIYNESERLNDAERVFKELISKNPDFYEAYYNLSIVAWKRKDFGEVKKLLETVLAKSPDYKEARQLLERVRNYDITVKN